MRGVATTTRRPSSRTRWHASFSPCTSKKSSTTSSSHGTRSAASACSLVRHSTENCNASFPEGLGPGPASTLRLTSAGGSWCVCCCVLMIASTMEVATTPAARLCCCRCRLSSSTASRRIDFTSLAGRNRPSPSWRLDRSNVARDSAPPPRFSPRPLRSENLSIGLVLAALSSDRDLTEAACPRGSTNTSSSGVPRPPLATTATPLTWSMNPVDR
mmetsp:Transcript_2672/g.5317  ORF Transcript_2672/g.5317 Transcript_2672/m.5317 type:complete len:215 (+) Transcript_2672:1068-1712(+)